MSKVLQKTTSGPEISMTYLHDIADGSNEFMIEMIDIFLHQTPAYIEEIDAAIISADFSVMAEIAHKVRPTFAFIGVEEATIAMAEIENLARSGKNLELIRAEFDRIKPMIGSVFIKLQEIKADLSAGL